MLGTALRDIVRGQASARDIGIDAGTQKRCLRLLPS
jgi:hypothetical protein